MFFFFNKYYNICQNVVKKRLGGPQKMPSKLWKLCNASKIQLKTYVTFWYALINQLICITNNECLILYHKAFRADYRAFSLTWPASMQINWNKRKRLQKKRVQFPQDLFGTPTWPPFYCFGTPIWPPWRHVKALYKSRSTKIGAPSAGRILVLREL